MTANPMVVNVMSEDEVAMFGRTLDAGSAGSAGFGALETDRGLLPLIALDVDARVAGVVASIEVAQTFVNTTGVAIEATYIFPLPDRAAVHRFRMEVAGRVIEGVVEERGAAREQYDEAIATGQRAAITEEERAGVFTLRVGNLMPGEAATVRLSLIGPLPVDDGEVTFRFPLVVAPRYMPGRGLGGDQAGLGVASDTDLVPDASRISPPASLPGCPNPVRLGLRVALEDQHVHDVASSLHAVTTVRRDAHVIEIQPGERIDRDFILRWRLDGSELRSSLVCADDADGSAGTFLLTLVPPSTTALAQKPRDVVFVIDRSGSMQGWKMVAARRAAARMIDTLTSRDRFTAIAFDTEIDLVPERTLVAASDRNRYRAVEQLAKIEARGGTELAEPLRRAASFLAGGTDDRERVIVLVTDGQVGDEDHILRELVPNLRNVKMFTLGIDQAVNAAFLKRLAAAGGGLCELVESEDRLDAVMAKVHRRIGAPIATEISVLASGLDLDLSATSPSRLPDVYAGAPVTIFGRYRGKASANAEIEVRGTSLGEPMHHRISRDPHAAAAPWLGASWARAAIRDLEDRYAAAQSSETEARIVAVSKKFGVLSRFTAFVAIDRSQIANKGGRLQQVVQPVESPDGWESGGGHRLRSAAPVARAAMPMSMPMPGSIPARPMPSPMPLPSSPPTIHASAASIHAPTGAPAQPEPRPSRDQGVFSPSRSSYSSPPPPAPRESKKAKAEVREEAASIGDAYLASLATLARELDAQGRGRADAAAIRVVRQRLTEWIEDVRSVDGNHELATIVERLVQRLSAALTGGTAIAAEAIAIAAELVALAAGSTAPPPKESRVAFWK
ncbi:MAG: VWA domain-containing protein [Deltaproteobacteria bacterium]|nr:VWA domain-containing protein [Deltaproteobacteria bacterium]